jgi:hypothetical protein
MEYPEWLGRHRSVYDQDIGIVSYLSTWVGGNHRGAWESLDGTTVPA